MASSLKKEKSKVRFRFFKWYEYVVNVREKSIRRGGICHSLYGYVIFMDMWYAIYGYLGINYWKRMVKTKNHQILTIGM